MLPKCPKMLCFSKTGTPINPNPRIWKMPTTGGFFLSHYHPGAVYEMRSIPLRGHGNQCVYDSLGTLMSGPPSGGTVDWYSPSSFGNILRHNSHDVKTFKVARELGRIRDYYSVRPSW